VSCACQYNGETQGKNISSRSYVDEKQYWLASAKREGHNEFRYALSDPADPVSEQAVQ
jgi:hypothetical protein